MSRNGRPQTAQATGVRGATSSQYHRAVTGGANDGRPREEAAEEAQRAQLEQVHQRELSHARRVLRRRAVRR